VLVLIGVVMVDVSVVVDGLEDSSNEMHIIIENVVIHAKALMRFRVVDDPAAVLSYMKSSKVLTQ
jgi:hypothetical protein